VELPPKLHLDLPARIGRDFASAVEVRLVDQTTSSWEFWFGLLLDYIETNGHARVPKEHVARGFKLGAWVGYQRTRHARGSLDAISVARLEALPGWSWSQLDEQWELGFAHLLSFVGREGHARAPQTFVEDGYRLGQWTAVQRSRYARGRINAERVARLEALPWWSWTPRDERWEEGYRHLLAYVTRYGSADAPFDHLEDGYKLGRWVKKQRHNRSRDPGDDRSDRLAALPGWTWEPFADQWERAFRSLLVFAQREGHGRVPQTHVEDGFTLGRWVAKQRWEHKRGRLTEDRAKRLAGLPQLVGI
jgi:helicase associated protein